MENISSSEKSPSRIKRVKRIKKAIVILFLFFMIVPTATAVILGIRLFSLKKELIKTTEQLDYYLELQSEMSFVDTVPDVEQTAEEEFSEDIITPDTLSEVLLPETLSKSEIDKLSLSEEELYEGYRKVYLTFDDGPSDNTNAILDVLKQYNVKATFFVVERDGKFYEKLYQRIVNEGHSIGLHSTTHEYSVVYKSEEAFYEDTNKLKNYIYLVTGVDTSLYRFPGGSSNRVSPVDMKVFANALHKNGMEYFDWNISSLDASAVLQSKDQIVYNVTHDLARHNEAIILFHDAGSKSTTVDALPEIIEYIQSLDKTVILPITMETDPIQHLTVD